MSEDETQITNAPEQSKEKTATPIVVESSETPVELSNKDKTVIELTSGNKFLSNFHKEPERAIDVSRTASQRLESGGFRRDEVMNLKLMLASAIKCKEELADSIKGYKGLEEVDSFDGNTHREMLNQSRQKLLKDGVQVSQLQTLSEFVASGLVGEENQMVGEFTRGIRGLENFTDADPQKAAEVFNRASSNLISGGRPRPVVDHLRVFVAESVLSANSEK